MTHERTAECRIQLVERQVEHLLFWLRESGPPGMRYLDELRSEYREMRREFPFDSEQPRPASRELDVDDMLREAENTIDQFVLWYEQPNAHGDARGAIVHQIAQQTRERLRALLEQREVTE